MILDKDVLILVKSSVIIFKLKNIGIKAKIGDTIIYQLKTFGLVRILV